MFGPGTAFSGEKTMDKARMAENAARGATGLTSLGLAEDGVLALIMRNDFAMFEAQAAAALLGLFFVPINWHFTHEEVGYVLADCGARVLVVQSDLLAGIEPGIPAGVKVIVVPTAEELTQAYGLDKAACDPAPGARLWGEWIKDFEPWTEAPRAERGLMTYTSGTTGRPKGVVKPAMTAEQSKTAKQIIDLAYGCRPGRCFLLTGPCYHIAVIHSAYMALMDEGDLVITRRNSSNWWNATASPMPIWCPPCFTACSSCPMKCAAVMTSPRWNILRTARHLARPKSNKP